MVARTTSRMCLLVPGTSMPTGAIINCVDATRGLTGARLLAPVLSRSYSPLNVATVVA